jgi:UDP-galactopyranose mutase
MKYDYLIVGSGLFGSVFAHEAKKRNKKCLVIDKRNHLGGNVFNENVEGINVHKYGAHIFHTNDEEIWKFVNQFVDFNNYINSPIAYYKGKIYNLPFNMNTFYQIWGITSPVDAQRMINEQIIEHGIINPSNLEEQAISLVGKDIFEILIKGYTEKQWGMKCNELPSFIIKRLPVRFTYDNNYFNDKYQGIPIGGYNKIIDQLLVGVDVKLNANFFDDRYFWESVADKIIYTGPIDEFFNFEFGELEYRSLRFENQILDIPNYQGNAVVNYTESIVPYTRVIEHKHFEFGSQKNTIITKEFPEKWGKNKEPYYPVNNEKNNSIFKFYKEKSLQYSNVIFGGRLAEYKYYDMHQIIASALKKSSIELNEK